MAGPQQPSFDLTSVGELLVDFVAPEVEDLASASAFIRTAGGAPANVAVAAARLGATTAFVGAVGDDPFGSYLEQTLLANGVHTGALKKVRERTTLAFVAGNRGGIPDFVFYRGADAALRPDDLPRDLIARSHFVHLSSLGLMTEPAASATLAAADTAHREGTLVSVDPNLRPSSWPSLQSALQAVTPLIEAADVLKVNDEEARLLTQTDDLETALGTLGREQSLIVVTRGAEGCLWRWHGQTGTVAAPVVSVADTTGAGDAFVGALLAELCAHGHSAARLAQLTSPELETILHFACAAGALSTTQPGAMASLPTRPEVEALLRAGG